MIEQFKKGNKAFQEGYFKDNIEELKRLVKEGQSPKTLFIACADSRYSPNLITQMAPGELFVVRNVGNFVPPFKSSKDFHGVATAIEFAVLVLKVKYIVICGHSKCGACEALFKDFSSMDITHIEKWLSLGIKAKEKVLKKAAYGTPKEEIFQQIEKTSVKVQTEHLLTYPFVKEGVEKGEITIYPMYYNMDNGALEDLREYPID